MLARAGPTTFTNASTQDAYYTGEIGGLRTATSNCGLRRRQLRPFGQLLIFVN
jgi:hypothetical protein